MTNVIVTTEVVVAEIDSDRTETFITLIHRTVEIVESSGVAEEFAAITEQLSRMVSL